MAKYGEGDKRWIVEERPDGTNVHNWHWVETNCLEWSRKILSELLQDLPILSGESNIFIRTKTLDKLDGEAYVNVRKGKIIPGYELSLTLSWEGEARNADGSTLLKVDGNVEIPYIADENADEDPDLRITVKDDGPVGIRLKDAFLAKGKEIVLQKIRIYVDRMAKGGPAKEDLEVKKPKSQPANAGAAAVRVRDFGALAMRAGEEEKRRLKREECKHNKHDSLFSRWELLLGPTDWEDYSRGKEGVSRYRLHNIPISCSCPGLYELGIAADHTNGSHRLRKYDSNRIVAVYVGQAENIRTRLQHYGRSGSHLDHGNSIVVASENKNLCLQRGPGLFTEIFSKGFSIVFRWAPMKNKIVAEETEAQLLKVFDYAWNNCGNGIRRREDILLKLDQTVSNATFISDCVCKLQQWKWVVLGKKRVGIKIDNGLPFNEFKNMSNGQKSNWGSQVPICGLSRPYTVMKEPVVVVCGVPLGDGTACTRRPVEGRKRCSEHRGKRISGSGSCRLEGKSKPVV